VLPMLHLVNPTSRRAPGIIRNTGVWPVFTCRLGSYSDLVTDLRLSGGNADTWQRTGARKGTEAIKSFNCLRPL
jgi:hypothetical protein